MGKVVVRMSQPFFTEKLHRTDEHAMRVRVVNMAFLFFTLAQVAVIAHTAALLIPPIVLYFAFSLGFLFIYTLMWRYICFRVAPRPATAG